MLTALATVWYDVLIMSQLTDRIKALREQSDACVPLLSPETDGAAQARSETVASVLCADGGGCFS